MSARIIAIFGFLLSLIYAQSQATVSEERILMGVDFSITVVHKNQEEGKKAIAAAWNEIDRIEKMISSWDPDSQTSQINRMAGIEAVEVDAELFELIERSKKISKISNGYFDISFASIHDIWDFENFDQDDIPTKKEIASSVKLIDWQAIVLDAEQNTVFLKREGMRIGFGAIGKGFAADRAKAILVERGVKSGVVNAGGDLLCWGLQADGKKWRVGIADPKHETKVMAYMDVTDIAVVTSGNYKKFLEIKGKRYCHIIDPKTGWPVPELASVTVISQTAELADALATTIFVLGVEEGMKLADHLSRVEGVIVDQSGKMHFSKNMNQYIPR